MLYKQDEKSTICKAIRRHLFAVSCLLVILVKNDVVVAASSDGMNVIPSVYDYGKINIR